MNAECSGVSTSSSIAKGVSHKKYKKTTSTSDNHHVDSKQGISNHNDSIASHQRQHSGIYNQYWLRFFLSLKTSAATSTSLFSE